MCALVGVFAVAEKVKVRVALHVPSIGIGELALSVIKRVARDTKHAENDMITAAAEAKTWLERLAEIEHRGRHDTWSAARDRAARKAGIEMSYAKRLWDRWQEMKDVSGETYRALKAAYDAQVERNNDAADSYRAQRMEANGRPTDEVYRAKDLGMGALEARCAEEAETITAETGAMR